MGLGSVSVPIHVQHKSREIAAQIENSEAVGVIAWDKLAAETEKAIEYSESCRFRIYLGDEVPQNALSFLQLLDSGTPRAADNDISPESLAAVMYTSGVSGSPRGAELTHGNFSHSVSELTQTLRLRESDKFLSVIPFSSISGLTIDLHLALTIGAETVIHSRFHPGDVLETMQQKQITVFTATPSMYRLVLGFPGSERAELSSLRYPLSVDSKLPAELAQDFDQKLNKKIFEAYGTTETTGPVAINLFPGLSGRDTVGQPLGGMEIVVRGEAGEILAPGVDGNVAIRGPLVMRGYRNRPERSRQALKDGWLNTGDVGHLDDQSYLVISSHSEERILKGGFPVHAREVEAIIEGLPHVFEVAVVGIADNLYGEEIKACVVLKEGASISPSEIIEYAKERLAPYKCPKIIKFYKELPRGAGGKVVRKELRQDKN